MRKVALYYPWIYLKSGVERVLLELIKRSQFEYTLFTSHIDYGQTFEEFKEFSDIRILSHVSVDRSFSHVLKAAVTIATEKIQLEGYDALLVSSEGLGDFINLRNHSLPSVCFCHTPVRPIYDPVYRQSWIEANPRKKWLLDAYSFFYRPINRMAWKFYDHVIANSSEVKSRIVRGGLYPEERIEVIHPGVDLERVEPVRQFDRYFLYAGRIKWTKNVELAIEAFEEFRKLPGVAPDWKLKIAGCVDTSSEPYLSSLQQQVREPDTVEFIPNPSDRDLDRLYQQCTGLLFTPLNEDWGIVPIEAMAWGKPVLAVNCGGPAESVIHGQTGFLLDPHPQNFAQHMARFVSEPELLSSMSNKAMEHAAAFSWQNFARKMDAAVESSISRQPS